MEKDVILAVQGLFIGKEEQYLTIRPAVTSLLCRVLDPVVACVDPFPQVVTLVVPALVHVHRFLGQQLGTPSQLL